VDDRDLERAEEEELSAGRPGTKPARRNKEQLRGAQGRWRGYRKEEACRAKRGDDDEDAPAGPRLVGLASDQPAGRARAAQLPKL
jgi:hypothetical protein